MVLFGYDVSIVGEIAFVLLILLVVILPQLVTIKRAWKFVRDKSATINTKLFFLFYLLSFVILLGFFAYGAISMFGARF